MSNKNQAGFSLVIVAIITVLLVGVIGYVSWNAYNQSQQKQASVTTGSSNTSTPPSKVNPTSATTTPAGTYLVIPELGIKILLNPQINDAVYAVIPPSSDGTAATDQATTVGISAKSLIDNQTSNYCEASGGAIGLIVRTTNPNIPGVSKGQSLTPDGNTVFKFGNDYYIFRRAQNDGCAVGKVTTDMVETKISAFTQAFKTVQPIN